MVRPATPTNWLKVIEQRLGEVDAAVITVADEIAQLEAQARRLNEERMHLRALLAIGQQPEDVASSHTDIQSQSGEGLGPRRAADRDDGASDIQAPVRAESLTPVLESRSTNSAQIWKESVRDLLVRGGRPLHYLAIHQELRRLGVTFGGQNPAASFLAVLNRDQDFSRVGRGTYWVKGSDPVRAAEKPRAAIRRSRAKVRKRR